MEALPRSTVYLKTIAAILGTIQGVTWVILSILCLHVHYDTAADDDFTPSSYFGLVNHFVADYFLDVNGIVFETQIWTNSLSIIFFLIYLFFDLIWAVLSIAILFKGKHLKHVLIFWGLATLLICGIDFVLVIILGADYNNCLHVDDSEDDVVYTISIEGFCANSILPVLVIAAKGFILWFINVLFAVVLLLEARHVDTEMIGSGQSPFHAGYDAFQDPRSPNNKGERSHFPHSNLPILDPQGYNSNNNKSLENRSPRTPSANRSPYSTNFPNLENSLQQNYNQQQDNLRNLEDNFQNNSKKQQRSRGANLPHLDIPYSNFRDQARNAERGFDNKFNRNSQNLDSSSPYLDNAQRNLQENFDNQFNRRSKDPNSRNSFLQSIENSVQNAYDKAKKKISSPNSDKKYSQDRTDPYGGPSFKNWNSPQPDNYYGNRK